ncbi:MAG: helix-turn-helix transcriptional regulator [Pseudomonadota bacterium]
MTDIYPKDIWPLPRRMGLSEERSDLEPDRPVMEGEFHFHAFHSGLSMHTNDAVEQQNNSSRLELPPGISFNIIYEGRVSFSFADEAFTLEVEDGLPTCTAIVNTEQEVMTRHMSAGMYVRKVNVFVERRWLENRCHDDADFRLLARVFQRKQVLRWRPGDLLLEKAAQLLEADLADGFSNLLVKENLTLQLLAPCMDELYARSDASDPEREIARPVSTSLKAHVNQQMGRRRTVSDIATSLNMSDRTLQRKFKAQYQETLSTYLKRRRLELAKKALLVDKQSIGEVAYYAGYNHSSNFVNAFKKNYGLTPKEYTAKHRRQ